MASVPFVEANPRLALAVVVGRSHDERGVAAGDADAFRALRLDAGAGEIAFTISRKTLVGGEFGEGTTLDDYIDAIGLPSGDRFRVFAREFLDLAQVPDDLPQRVGC